MDWDLLKFLFEVVSGLCAAFAAYALLFLNSRYKPRVEMKTDEDKAKVIADESAKKLEERFRGLGAQLTSHDQRLIILEQSLGNVPKRADLQAVSDKVSDVANRLAELSGQQDAQNKLLGTIHDHLLNRGGS